MSEPRFLARFPSTSLVSAAEYEEYRREQAAALAAHRAYERGLVAVGGGIAREGTCASCQRRSRFTARLDTASAPDWRSQFHCDCEDRLDSRQRAMAHFLAAAGGMAPWSRVLLFGPASALEPHLAARAGEVVRTDGLVASDIAAGYRLEAESGSFHLLASVDQLQHVPPLEAALGEFRRVLAPGGICALALPFRAEADRTASGLAGLPRRDGRLPAEAGAEVHRFGWDLLDRLRQAGFADARAHLYWSNELGYLGPDNVIVSAVA